MRRTMLKSKIHRATVTATDLEYEGSLTIDAELLHAADILPHEQIHVGDVVIVATFTTLKTRQARRFTPAVVFVDGDNKAKPTPAGSA